MKNLNLDALGVQEMCTMEMMEIDGGGILEWFRARTFAEKGSIISTLIVGAIVLCLLL